MLEGRVLITGGAGFLGRGIMRAASMDKWPAEFTVYSRDEFKQDLCRRKYPQAKYVLGDIRDVDRLALLAHGHDVIIHAAALKYVPEAEHNVDEAIGVNILGTRAVLQAAIASDVEKVVVISTDKAVNPLNTYGMTKAIMERMVSEMASISQRQITMVRYGNVIGSTGSVIPIFKRMAKEGKTINITDPNMTRFWLTVYEAVELIVQALDESVTPGAIIVKELPSMSIMNLADAIVPHADKVVVGQRGGEKLHEDLNTLEESRWMCKWTTGHFEILPVASRTGIEMRTDRDTFIINSGESIRMSKQTMLDAIEDAEQV